jgi:hypothetical protein
MDVSIASYYIEIKKIKVPKWGTPKKYLKKKKKKKKIVISCNQSMYFLFVL